MYSMIACAVSMGAVCVELWFPDGKPLYLLSLAAVRQFHFPHCLFELD